MVIVKKIGVLSLAKISAVINAVMGLILGLIMSLMTLVTAALGTSNMEGVSMGAGVMFGAGSVIVLPIMYGLMGFIGGAISAFIYNLVATYIGGLEIEISDKPAAAPVPTPSSTN